MYSSMKHYYVVSAGCDNSHISPLASFKGHYASVEISWTGVSPSVIAKPKNNCQQLSAVYMETKGRLHCDIFILKNCIRQTWALFSNSIFLQITALKYIL